MSFSTYLAENSKDAKYDVVQGLTFSRASKKMSEDGLWNAKSAKLAADYFAIPLAKAPKDDVSEELLEVLPLHVAKSSLFFPLTENKDGSIVAAIGSPERAMDIADDYERVTGKTLDLQFMPEDKLLKLINETWDKKTQKASEVVDAVENESNLQSLTDELAEPEDLLDSGNDAPIIRLINTVLSQALKDNASDIHIEPFEKQVSVRFRVDGVMHTVVTPSKKLHAAMSARLKVMASLDIAEKRLPQDGRFKIRVAGREVDIRISTLPTQHGERIVMRLLGQQEGIRQLNAIGLRPEQQTHLHEMFNLANGIILISGPTGSGKTSTLYAGLQHINTPDKNIVTVEDPVEYELEGLGQIQVNSKIGMTFAAGLRSILRQDPDVVVIGETRDLETAQISVEASLTGHLVISTIHTNSSCATVTRLLEMGIEPFLVASSLRTVIAQRMVRLLHPTARKPVIVDDTTWNLFKENLPTTVLPKREDITLFEPMPTEDCPTGYAGRSGIFEILSITDNIRALINNNANDQEIQKQAAEEGLLTLFQEGLLKATKGETTIEEVLRVTRTQG